MADKAILVADLFVLPPLVAPNPDLHDVAKLVHTWIAWLCGAPIGGHVLLTLKHHFVDKDDILKGMLPLSTRGYQLLASALDSESEHVNEFSGVELSKCMMVQPSR